MHRRLPLLVLATLAACVTPRAPLPEEAHSSEEIRAYENARCAAGEPAGCRDTVLRAIANAGIGTDEAADAVLGTCERAWHPGCVFDLRSLALQPMLASTQRTFAIDLLRRRCERGEPSACAELPIPLDASDPLLTQAARRGLLVMDPLSPAALRKATLPETLQDHRGPLADAALEKAPLGDEILRAMSRAHARCAPIAKRAASRLHARLHVGFAAAGEVTFATVLDTTDWEPLVLRCLLVDVSGWRVAPSNAGAREVLVPFAFGALEDDEPTVPGVRVTTGR